MNNFELIAESSSQLVVVGLDYMYPNIFKIEESLSDTKFTGTVYIDALMSRGTAFNRFVSGNAIDGILDRKSLKLMEPCMEIVCLKSITSQFFKENQQYLENNILTDDEKQELLR